jgi:hypothetical protein
MKHSLRRDFKVLAVITCLGIFIYFTGGFWHDQFLVYYLGRIEVAAEHYQNLPKDIDTIEVFTLGDDPNEDHPIGYETNGFVGDLTVITLDHKTLTGNDAKEIIDLWGEFPVGREFQAMCFDPVYGLQFKRKGQIYFQTSVCWHCSGYTLPVPPFGTVQYGFDAKSKGAQKLLETLERHLPLPPEPKKVQPQKPATGITNS